MCLPQIWWSFESLHVPGMWICFTFHGKNFANSLHMNVPCRWNPPQRPGMVHFKSFCQIHIQNPLQIPNKLKMTTMVLWAEHKRHGGDTGHWSPICLKMLLNRSLGVMNHVTGGPVLFCSKWRKQCYSHSQEGNFHGKLQYLNLGSIWNVVCDCFLIWLNFISRTIWHREV